MNGKAINAMNKMKLIRISAKNRLWSGRKPLLTRVRRLLWAAALLLPAFAARADVVFTNLYSFTGTNDGGNPSAGLVQGRDGYFYGTTEDGGANYSGTVFKISTNGTLISLYSFTGTNDGAYPQAALAQGTDGYFYGTTIAGGNTNLNNYGGLSGYGTVFKINDSGTLTSLHSFAGYDGETPQSALVQGSDGNFYGTTTYGGNTSLNSGFGYGTVFKISTNGVLTKLYSFGSIQDTNGNPLDGAYPGAVLVRGADNYFYGTTSQGGTLNYDPGYGTVFKISTNRVLQTLHVFGTVTNGSGQFLDGVNPGSLAQGSDGSFYGTTAQFMITFPFDFVISYSTVFKISTSGVLETLYSFSPYYTIEGFSYSPAVYLVQGSNGNLYGTIHQVPSFGSPYATSGSGSVFKLCTNGVLNTLHSFNYLQDGDGAGPNMLVQSRDGNFYGTTSSFGPGGYGTIFRLTIVPEFQTLTLTNGTLTLTWSTEAGGIYQLQSSASLNIPNWTNLGSPATATNGTLTFTDSVTNAPQRFYRVSLAP